MVSAVREASRQMPYPLPGAFFLTDPKRTPDPVSVVNTLPNGTGVIYRHFGAAEQNEVAKALRAATYRKGIALLIANDPDLAIATKADGVHWPEARAQLARKWQGRFLIQTQSAHSRRAIAAAVCDAILFSTVFPSNSASAGASMGPVRFRRLVMRTEKTVYALGGVNAETAARVSGFAGLAAIEGFICT